MKTLLTALTVTTALTMPAMAMAKQVTFKTTINEYWGRPAFLAFYVTDANGRYKGSLWMAGWRTQYYRHLTDWYRASGGSPAQVSGITGASVGPGRSLEFTADLSDALFDAGYVLHIDAAAEDLRESPSDVTIPLTSANAGKDVQGRAYIADFHYDM